MRWTSFSTNSATGLAAWVRIQAAWLSAQNMRPSFRQRISYLHLPEPSTWNLGEFSARLRHYPIVRDVLGDQRPGANHAELPDRNVVPDGRIYSDEGVLLDQNPARDHHVRGNETIVLDPRVVPYVVPAPERDVVPDVHEGLDGVVLEDETVLADAQLGPHGRLAADVTGQLVPLRLRVLTAGSA